MAVGCCKTHTGVVKPVEMRLLWNSFTGRAAARFLFRDPTSAPNSGQSTNMLGAEKSLTLES